MTNKITLKLLSNSYYSMETVEFDPKDFLLSYSENATDLIRYGWKLYAIGNEFGALCLCFAQNEQDAFDKACDEGKLTCLEIESEEDYTEHYGNYCACGNEGKLHNMEYAWLQEVDLNSIPKVMWYDIGRKTGEGLDTLDD